MAGGRNIIYMRRDCINAVEDLVRQVEKLPYVHIEMDGRYYSNTNKFAKPTGKAAAPGARLGIVLGGGDRDVTTYAFHMRDLSSKDNVRPVSLRYTPDGGKPAIIAARSMPDGTAGEVEGLDASGITSVMARMMNSISFGPMFQGWSSTVKAGTGEERALKNVLETQAAGKSWGAVLPMLSSPDPLEGMAAWGAMSMARGGKVDPDADALWRTAKRAMGLERLEECLTEINAKIAADPDYRPDLSEHLDARSAEGRLALRGLACLSAYKEARDHGGVYAKDDAGKSVIGIAMDDPATKAVYDSLVYVRPRAELKQRAISDAEASRCGLAAMSCVQSTYAGIARDSDRAPDCTVSNGLRYRFYRSAMLGEDPDMKSKAPDFTLRLRGGADPKSLKNLSANDILVQSTSLSGGQDMQPFGTFLERAMEDPSGREAAFIKQFPAIADRMSMPGGNKDLEQMAVSRVQKTAGEPLDGLSLEIELFTDKSNKGRLMGMKGPGGQSADDLANQFVANFVAAHTKAPQLSRSLDDATGFPEFSRGTDGFGYCVLSDLSDAGVLKHPDYTVKENGTDNPAKTARAFRKADRERGAAETRYRVLDENGRGPESMEDVMELMGKTGATGVFNGHIYQSRVVGMHDQERGAMMINDFVVLADCYGIQTEQGLVELSYDVQQVYAGKTSERSLYRPKDRGEKSAIAEIYGKGGADIENAFVPVRFQGSREGFLLAAWRGIGEDSALKDKAVDSLRACALDADTLEDCTYGDLAERLDGPPRSEKAMDMMLSQRRAASPEDPGMQNTGVDYK